MPTTKMPGCALERVRSLDEGISAAENAAFSCNCSLSCAILLGSGAWCTGPIPSAVTEQPDATIARTTIEEIHFNMCVTEPASFRVLTDRLYHFLLPRAK